MIKALAVGYEDKAMRGVPQLIYLGSDADAMDAAIAKSNFPAVEILRNAPRGKQFFPEKGAESPGRLEAANREREAKAAAAAAAKDDEPTKDDDDAGAKKAAPKKGRGGAAK